MENSDLGLVVSDITDPDMQKFSHEGIPCDSKDVGELQHALEVSSEVDMSLAYSSEKLAHLENLLLRILSTENDIRAIGIGNDTISEDLVEMAFEIDLLLAILIFELKELDSLMGDVQNLIVDSHHKISSCEKTTELFTGLVSKLHDSEELMKQLQERILEIKIQIAKLHMTSFSFKQHEWKQDLVMEVNEPIQLVEQSRIIRMLEKSLAKELELEKKLTEFKQNEKDLNLKVRLVEQVSVYMEEAAEVALGRFFEADNRSEVLMGISKEMTVKLQTYHVNLIGATNREEELKSKLNDCSHQLNVKETSIEKLNNRIAHLMTDNSQVANLREKVENLEKNLIESDSRLKKANSSNETSQQQIKEMEVEMESLKEEIDTLESRITYGEEKITNLTESNLELTEELDFLKNSNDSNAKKANLLEKQLRELDIQLQHSRASSEVGQEQQNMLYSAIWDMETLIDELKQNVAKGESKNVSVEEQCIILSEKNSELNKELDFLRSRIRFFETSLERAAFEKMLNAKDISIKSSLIMDTVMQLGMERERVQKQLISLTKENISLREILKKEQKHASTFLQNNRSCDDKEFPPPGLDSADAEHAKFSTIKVTEISSESFQAEKS